MYLGIDVGGTKTLLAVFSAAGEVVHEHKFPTKAKYQAFLKDLRAAIAQELKDYRIAFCCCALPGLVDRKAGVGLFFGNLNWKHVPMVRDLQQSLPHAKILIENDANLAGLSEANLVLDKYKKVLYLTISTGINDGFIIDGVIDADLADSEPGHTVLEHEGKLQKWEDFASGSAIVKRYGKRASEIDDPVIWQTISRNIALGLNELIASLHPEVVIVGGGVGAHFDKFGALLNAELHKMESDMVKMPPVIGAKRPEEAVIYGCYELIRQKN